MMAIAQRLTAEMPGKIAGTVMYACCLVAYVSLQHLRGPVATLIPWSPIDLRVPEMPFLAWVYVGQLAIFGIPTLLIADRQRLNAHLMGYLGIVLATLICFALWPTMIERPTGGAGLVSVVRSIDGTGNAFPSLHAACAVYAALSLRYAMRVPRMWTVIAWTWTAIVLVSCVSLRQHTTYDVVAGVLLAIIADRCVVWRLSHAGERLS